MAVASEARRKQLQLNFRARLKRALDAKEWTQKDLAQRLGVAESSVTGWLRHGALPGADILFELPYVLGVSADWLLVGRGEQRPPQTHESPSSQFIEGGRAALDEARRELDDCLKDLGIRWHNGTPKEITQRAARALDQEEQESREIRSQPKGVGRRRQARRKAQ